MPPRLIRFVAALAFALPLTVSAQSLSPVEQRIRDHVYAHTSEAIALIERTVNINSGTMNFAGVRAVGDAFASELQALGFKTRWVDMSAVNRSGHLIAERGPKPRRGRARAPRGKRLLIIGHLDTVFEGEGQKFRMVGDTLATGAGTNDMKGGNVVAIQTLKALHSVGALDGMQVIVVFTGDEESSGDPLSISRRDLIDVAKRSDVALAFESGEPHLAAIARRSSGDWILQVTGKQAHSSGMFGENTGYGAIYESARILDAFRTRLAGQPFLTFSPGVVVGGTEVSYDTAHTRGSAAGKTNIVPRAVVVHGDLRALTQAQIDSTRAVMRAIVESGNLPMTSARIDFGDGYPPMAPTPGNEALLREYDSISRALGLGEVTPHDPMKRGAGDISFVAPLMSSLDGLGPWGRGGHTPEEDLDLRSVPAATARAAILMYRLGVNR